MWARPPIRSTATCMRARSACCASRPARGWESTIPHCARRSAKIGSRCSAGAVHEGASMTGLLTEIDHVAIAVRDLEAAIAYYREAFGAEVEHREVVERDGVEEA